MTIFGDGLQTRAFSYISDVAPIIARAPLVGAAYQQVFNIGAEQSETVLALAHATAHAFGVEPQILHLPPRHEVVHAFASHDKARRVFQPERPVLLTEGLRRMAQWARQRGPMTPTDFGGLKSQSICRRRGVSLESSALDVTRLSSAPPVFLRTERAVAGRRKMAVPRRHGQRFGDRLVFIGQERAQA